MVINIEPANKPRSTDICDIHIIIWYYHEYSNRIFRLRKLLKRGEETTVQCFNMLTKAPSQFDQLIDEILTEIDARQKFVDKLQEDIETYYKNTEIKKSDVEAISQLLRGEIRKENQRSLWQNIVINSTFFCAGVVITYLIGFSISI